LQIIDHMTSPSWDPEQYQRFASERSRPFYDLVGQVSTVSPRDVIDLGCGLGHLTADLAQRWPQAYIHGIDSSPEMIRSAQPLTEPGRLGFSLDRIEDWQPEPESLDVIVSNAALQWVPTHVELLPGWIGALRPGGSLAVQLPQTSESPAMAVFQTVATSPPWADRLAAVARGRGPRAARSPVRSIEEYVDLLAPLGVRINAWETSYLHLLAGQDPVLEWFAGTGLRPYLDALAGDEAALDGFRMEVAARLREAYPARPYGTVLPFRRIFVVAARPA
jgi:trans-aconitate 2-methyltransferase